MYRRATALSRESPVIQKRIAEQPAEVASERLAGTRCCTDILADDFRDADFASTFRF